MNEFNKYAVHLATLITIRLKEAGLLLNPDVLPTHAIPIIIDCIVEATKNTKEDI